MENNKIPKIEFRQISSLEKIRSEQEGLDAKTIEKPILLKGEEFSYQLYINCEKNLPFDYNWFKVSVESDLDVKVYDVKNANMDFPTYENPDDYYITTEPGLMPDILMPIEEQKNWISVRGYDVLWVKINVPENAEAKDYSIKITLVDRLDKFTVSDTFTFEVIDAVLPQKGFLYSQFIHLDGISAMHKCEVFSDEFFDYLDKYIAAAAEAGITDAFTPVITPAMDTEVGHLRRFTQLVQIEKTAEGYKFDYTYLKKWFDLCQKHGINNFTISYLFSQWGSKYSPNILVKENGELKHMFGWHVLAKDPKYVEFLKAFVPSLIEYIKSEGLLDRCLFHISDEPVGEQIEDYKFASDLIRPLLNGCKTIDALSDIEFYNKGLVDYPVCAIDWAEPFLEAKVPNFVVYYCCAEFKEVSNRFLSMPSARNRIIGLQFFKNNIYGFLHWGFNFYNSFRSLIEVNPFMTTSGNRTFPSGDAFSVYPGENGPLLSLRAVVFKEALTDMYVCRKLSEYIGRDKVIEMIEKEAGMDITFKKYPHGPDFILNLSRKLKEEIKKHI